MLVLGRLDWVSAGWDVAYLVALTGFGFFLARRLFAKRLVV
jgi:hypothetical protein